MPCLGVALPSAVGGHAQLGMGASGLIKPLVLGKSSSRPSESLKPVMDAPCMAGVSLARA